MIETAEASCFSCGYAYSHKPGIECRTPSKHSTPEPHQVWVMLNGRWEIRGTGAL